MIGSPPILTARCHGCAESPVETQVLRVLGKPGDHLADERALGSPHEEARAVCPFTRVIPRQEFPFRIGRSDQDLETCPPLHPR